MLKEVHLQVMCVGRARAGEYLKLGLQKTQIHVSRNPLGCTVVHIQIFSPIVFPRCSTVTWINEVIKMV